jgi:excisionase family DNA binding protein
VIAQATKRPPTLLGVDEYLTEAEVAELLKVSVGTLRRWRREGTGPPSLRLGRGVRYRRRDVDRWAERQRERGS